MALAEAGSPYLSVVDTVRAALPDPAPRDLEKALALARSGPPAEEVGLEPFGPPEIVAPGGMGGRR
jgi:nitrate reductase delta subunit